LPSKLAGPPGGGFATCTWTWSARTSAAFQRCAEATSPVEKTTVALPRTIASRVSSVRAGRTTGTARPRLIARGRRDLESIRCTPRPRPVRDGAAESAAVAVVRPARSAGVSAVSATSAGIATITAAVSPGEGVVSRPSTYVSLNWLSSQAVARLPRTAPTAQPTSAGPVIISR
jgi:hypothetical protein